MPQVALSQATIEYRVLGPEDSPHPPVLFIHGILVDHRLWTEVAEGLARRGFRCILPTLPLGSHSIPIDENAELSPIWVAKLIGDFITELDLGDVTLVGSDTSGGLCQLVIDAYPEQVGRLVLTNCDAFDTFPPFPLHRHLRRAARPQVHRIDARTNAMESAAALAARLRPARH